LEEDVFLFEGFQHLVLSWPEVFLGKRISSQSVLVGHHHELVVRLFGDLAKVRDGFGEEFQLFQAVNLIICRRLFDDGAVPVYEEYFFHFLFFVNGPRTTVHGLFLIQLVYLPIVECGQRTVDFSHIFLNASKNFSFSSRVPTVMRRQSSQRSTLALFLTMTFSSIRLS